MDLSRYNIELEHISGKLNQLMRGEYHERVKKPGVPAAMTIAAYLQQDILDLLAKIKKEAPGMQESLNKAANIDLSDMIR